MRNLLRNLRLMALALMLCVFWSSPPAHAQLWSIKSPSADYNKPQLTAPDTVNNATTVTLFTKQIVGAKDNVTFQVDVSKISGTLGGYIQLKGSIDTGATYVWLATDTLTNATNQYGFSFPENRWQWYEMTVTTTGTQQSSYMPWLLYR